jgi:DNA repair exonuclease SbcCD ATPase subunit
MDARLLELKRKFEALEQASKEGNFVPPERVAQLERELAGLRARRAALEATLGRVTKALRQRETKVEILDDEDASRPHACPTCGKTYKDKSSLVRHVGTVHKR